jgi:hypothetical protein
MTVFPVPAGAAAAGSSGHSRVLLPTPTRRLPGWDDTLKAGGYRRTGTAPASAQGSRHLRLGQVDGRIHRLEHRTTLEVAKRGDCGDVLSD